MSILKRWVWPVDAAVLGGRLKRGYNRRMELRVAKEVQKDFSLQWNIYYSKDEKSELSGLCDLYGSDKGELTSIGHPYNWPSHTFADIYTFLFAHCRQKIEKVFECGLGTNNPDLPSSMSAKGKPGASLRVWRDYFPSAQIIGVDIDPDILFEEDRIKTFQLDQTSKSSIAAFWDGLGMTSFDFMLDDGLHEFDAGVCLFENSVQHLATDGIYVIEDILPPDRIRYSDYFRSLKSKFSVHFVDLQRPHLPLGDNCLLIIRRK